MSLEAHFPSREMVLVSSSETSYISLELREGGRGR